MTSKVETFVKQEPDHYVVSAGEAVRGRFIDLVEGFTKQCGRKPEFIGRSPGRIKLATFQIYFQISPSASTESACCTA
jgi:hypothetical protein